MATSFSEATATAKKAPLLWLVKTPTTGDQDEGVIRMEAGVDISATNRPLRSLHPFTLNITPPLEKLLIAPSNKAS